MNVNEAAAAMTSEELYRFYKHMKSEIVHQYMTPCWVWLGATNDAGYGNFTIQGKKFRVHRLSAARTHGALEDGEVVLHRCDNPPCANPDHLLIGTQAANVKDMIDKGRENLTGSAKLDKYDVACIRYAYQNGKSKDFLAAYFRVHVDSITNILIRKTWKDDTWSIEKRLWGWL